MISNTQRPVRMVSKAQTPVLNGSAAWGNAARLMGFAAAFAVTAALGGCGASPSHQADAQAQSASAKASMLLATAGRYHAKASFPVAISSPLDSGAMVAAVRAAKGNPAAYIEPVSVARDLRQAYAALSSALGDSALNFQFKGLLEMQRGQVSLASAQLHANQLSQAIMQLQNQVLSLDSQAARVGNFAAKMAFLKEQHDLYVHLYDKDLQHARDQRKIAADAVAAAQKKLDAVTTTLAHYQALAKNMDQQGMALHTQGELTVTPVTLADFKRGAGLLNQAAAANQQATVLAAHQELAELSLNSAKLEVQQWANQVAALEQAQKAAVELAQSDDSQVAAIKAGVTVLIDGNGKSPTSVAGRAARINKLLETIAKQSALAKKFADDAAGYLATAINEQRRAGVYAQSLISSGYKPDDPLVKANNSRAAECILNIYSAAAALNAGQIAAMRMYAAQLQQSASEAGRQIFTVVAEQSPLSAPATGTIEKFRKQALAQFNANAAGALNRAKMLYPARTSSLQWIVPAMLYNVDVSVANIANDAAVRAAALKAAATSAQAAEKLNTSLHLPLPQQ